MKEGYNLSLKLTNKVFYIIFAIAILGAIGAGVYATTITSVNPGHNSNQVYIQYPGGYISLQNALDRGYLIASSPSISSYDFLPTSTPYHLASQILITKSGYTMTLQEAINHKVFINGASASYTTTLSVGGDYATNVNINTINGVISLQNAITSNLLSPCSVGYHWDNSQNKCVVNCASNMGQGCAPGGSAACSSGFTIQCDGSCIGGTYLAFGTSCGNKVGCDGSGHCVGYSGSGCGSCPFGTTNNSNCGNSNTLCHTCPNGQGDCSNHWGGFDWRAIGWAMVCSYQTCGISGCSNTDVQWDIYPGGPNADPYIRIC